MSTETPLKFLVDVNHVNGYASTNMQLFYMLKSYDYIIRLMPKGINILGL